MLLWGGGFLLTKISLFFAIKPQENRYVTTLKATPKVYRKSMYNKKCMWPVFIIQFMN